MTELKQIRDLSATFRQDKYLNITKVKNAARVTEMVHSKLKNMKLSVPQMTTSLKEKLGSFVQLKSSGSGNSEAKAEVMAILSSILATPKADWRPVKDIFYQSLRVFPRDNN